MHGEDVDWTLSDQLLAAAVDALHVANWQRSAKKGQKRPKPIPRPGIAPDETTRKIGSGARPLAELDAIFGRALKKTK